MANSGRVVTCSPPFLLCTSLYHQDKHTAQKAGVVAGSMGRVVMSNSPFFLNHSSTQIQMYDQTNELAKCHPSYIQ